MIDPVHEPPQDSGAQTIGALRFIGIVLGLGILFLVLMILAGVVIPLLMLNFMSSGVLAGIIGLLLTIGVAVLGVRWCNSVKDKQTRTAMYIGFAIGAVPMAFVNLMFSGICLTSSGMF